MKINNIVIRNFKSFGNDSQTLKISDDGNLILLSGKNGSGKSSIIDSLDYAFYNKVQGRKSKKAKLASLPNRINSDMEVNVEFISDDSTLINIKRGYSPSKLELRENGVLNNRAGKDKINQVIEDYVGIDHETFKGFISMSINDFKNFISLSNEEKKLLLDKLFNLEVITILNKVLNDLIRENKKEYELLDKEIDIINDNIDNINLSINKAKKTKKDNLSSKLEEIKQEIESYKEPFSTVKEKMGKVKTKQKELTDKINEEKTSLIEVGSEIKQIDKQLQLFANDKCPTCQADLSSGFHQGIKESFEEKRAELSKIRDEIKSKGSLLKGKKEELDAIYEKGQTKYNDLNSTLLSLKKQYDRLKKEDESNQEDDGDLDEFYKTIDNLNEKKDKAEKGRSDKSDKKEYHKILKQVLSENGIKKTIIENIVEPINVFIRENLQKMHLPFEVVLDDSFTADITSFGEEIDIDTISTGENKAINIAIMLAYLKLIRTKRQINVLFLDEVFSSIDVERINDVVGLLRDLADNSKINIFLVHHSILDSQHFDRIIKMEKDVFSYINEIDV